jgi:hypothetical protein
MIWLLLVVYQIKHFLADYPLQGKFMLGKFLPFPKFILPLLAHASVHSVFTFLIAWCFKDWHFALALGLGDGIVHFIVDRIKASPELGGRFKALTKETYTALMAPDVKPDERAAALKSNTYFWWALGADQMAHHLTHYLLIYLILR